MRGRSASAAVSIAATAPANVDRKVGATKNVAQVMPQLDLGGIVRVLTCGSVDDGKSTLIGRLLWDASDLFEDQREALRRSERRALGGKYLDYSLLVDGLIAEREQGITIDIAWRYFDTAHRRFVIIDSPGHEQYTRNMASGASHADVAVMLIDARHGIKSQTRRHAAILGLFGVRRVVLAVNKMDLVEWSEVKFRAIETEFKSIARRFKFEDVSAIPVAAVSGDCVARRSAAMPWYKGPTLLEYLNQVTASASLAAALFRMPVQTVLRDGQDFRGLAGTISAGRIAVGEPIVDPVSGGAAKIKRIATMDGDLAAASAGQAVVLELDRDIDVSRGAVLAAPASPPVAARSVTSRFVWLAEQPFDPKVNYLLRTATDLVPVSWVAIEGVLNLETLAQAPATSCATNDIVVAGIGLGRATALEPFADAATTGNFILVDGLTGATVAGGVVVAAHATSQGSAQAENSRDAGIVADTFVLTRAILFAGICADLAASDDNETELRRRADATTNLLRAAGVRVSVDLTP